MWRIARVLLFLFRPAAFSRVDAKDVIEGNSERRRPQPPKGDQFEQRLRYARKMHGRLVSALALLLAAVVVGAVLAWRLPVAGPTLAALFVASGVLAVLATLGAVEQYTVFGSTLLDQALKDLYRALYFASVLLLSWGTLSGVYG